ncbi:MAG: hypothetical protein AAGF73_17935, partial [Actinomycetota bacterium]
GGALFSAGWGEDDSTSETLPPVTEGTAAGSTVPGTEAGGSTGSSGEYTYPTGSDDVVVEYAEVGGFTTQAFAFQNPPSVLISGDGLVFGGGATIAVFPGPLVPPVFVRTITPEGIETVLANADQAGLLAEVDYDSEAAEFVADAPTATVTIAANDQRWIHQAYALGVGGGPEGSDDTPEREALQSFVLELGDLATLVGADQLGEERPFEAADYLFLAVPLDDPTSRTFEAQSPTIVEWPVDASVRLADAAECAEISADEVGDLFAEADQLTFFDDGGVVYEVIPKPVLPGDACT